MRDQDPNEFQEHFELRESFPLAETELTGSDWSETRACRMAVTKSENLEAFTAMLYLNWITSESPLVDPPNSPLTPAHTSPRLWQAALCKSQEPRRGADSGVCLSRVAAPG
jgi:hypothetical protein